MSNGIDSGVLSLRRADISMSELADKLGISRQAISKWTRVPAERVLDVARFTGISPSVLRRDLFGRKRIS